MKSKMMRLLGGWSCAPRMLLALGSLALGGAACAEWTNGDELNLDTESDELVCSGAACTCSPTFGIGFVQGSDGTGTVPNFELVVPHTGGGFSAYYRNNATTSLVSTPTWFGPKKVGSADVNGISMIENSSGGNLEVIAVQGSSLVHYYRNQSTKAWSSGTTVATGVTGQPGIVQAKLSPGNFEVVVPLASGGLAHYWRDNSVASHPWSSGTTFATGRTYSAVSLVESNFGTNRLEVIARSGSTLYSMYRRDDRTWTTPNEIRVDNNQAISATGVHQFVQGKGGTKGNFELVVPLSTGGLRHYYRDNDDSAYPWKTSATWVDPINSYSAAGVIWSDYDNLEVVGRRSADGSLASFYYNGGWVRHGQDASGNTVWAGSVFGGEPCCDPATKGQWSDPLDAGAIGIHAALLRTGKVLLFGFTDDSDQGYSEVFDPATGQASLPSGTQPHAFCSGHAFLSDGRLWVAGGHGDAHVKGSHRFDPSNSTWASLTDMTLGRWYPTLTRLDGGSVLAISGTTKTGRISSTKPVNSSWQTLNTAGTLSARSDVPEPFTSDGRPIQLYPFVFQLPDGKVFVHSGRGSRLLTTSNNTWSATQYTTQYANSRTYPGYGSAVLLPLSPTDNHRARVMVIGGGGAVSNAATSDPNDTAIPATATTELLDLGAASPAWSYKASMNYARVLNTAVLLPDGKVFVVGGSARGSSDHATTPVMTPEIYNPSNNTWTKMCPMRVARLYHSTALLLPDARVLTAGRDHAFNELPYKWPERRVEIFTPPYLLSGNARPVIQSVASTASYGQSISVTLSSAVAATGIGSAMLMSPGSVTHGFDQSQRAVKLAITGQSGSTLTLTAPPNGKVAPPGYYMLFVVSTQGVPSVAKFVKLQ
ncbi:galactose oxidase-like domain-containing protein [Sorangium sp. KYC3313]|uniref:galactose oxidase-like domain-containing protein n=1 Tax=Sorangium sp. KYC3313 TaxID=3449740 RepID=UPI003F8CB891